MSLYAWAWTPDAQRLNEWRDRFPGLRLIHYPATYRLARPGDAAIVGSADTAERIAAKPSLWSFAILGDEPDAKGVTPDAYLDEIEEARSILREDLVPIVAAGIANPTRAPYAAALANVGIAQGVNYRLARQRDAHRMMATLPDRRWLPTLLPLRLTLWPLRYLNVGAWLWQALMVRPKLEGQLRDALADPRNVGVALWCLREGRHGDGAWQASHGLLDRHDRLTWQGRVVQRLLAES